MSSGGDSIRTCGFSALFRCGMQYFDTMKVPRVLMPIIRSNRFISVACELVRLMALALLTQISMPPNSATVLSIAAITCASSRISQRIGNALPPPAPDGVGKPAPDPGSAGVAYMVHLRPALRLRDVHGIVDHINDHLQHGGDDAAAAGRPRHQHRLAVLQHDGRRHRG